MGEPLTTFAVFSQGRPGSSLGWHIPALTLDEFIYVHYNCFEEMAVLLAVNIRMEQSSKAAGLEKKQRDMKL